MERNEAQVSATMVYATFPTRDAAEAVAKTLVEARLAACVNILPGMISCYHWQGQLERADEVVMLVKTRRALADRVAETIRARHPYEVPAVLFLAVDGGLPAYLGWIASETTAEA